MPRRRRAVAQINVVPYIDVMLVLLVIFMVSAPLMQPGIVNLPSVAKSDKQLPQKPLRVEIDAQGGMRLVDGSSIETVADLIALRNQVQARTQGAPRPVVIAADQDIRYREVMAVVSELRRHGIKQVGLAVEPAR